MTKRKKEDNGKKRRKFWRSLKWRQNEPLDHQTFKRTSTDGRHVVGENKDSYFKMTRRRRRRKSKRRRR